MEAGKSYGDFPPRNITLMRSCAGDAEKENQSARRKYRDVEDGLLTAGQ